MISRLAIIIIAALGGLNLLTAAVVWHYRGEAAELREAIQNPETGYIRRLANCNAAQAQLAQSLENQSTQILQWQSLSKEATERAERALAALEAKNRGALEAAIIIEATPSPSACRRIDDILVTRQ